MKKILVFFLTTFFFMACSNSDEPEIEQPLYYMVESLTFSIEEGDGLVIDKKEEPSMFFPNNTSETIDVSFKDSLVSGSEFVFLPDEHISFDLHPDYSYRTNIPDSLENGKIKYTSTSYPYTENEPIYEIKSVFSIEDVISVSPYTNLFVAREQEIKRLTLSYQLNLYNGLGEHLEIKGKWKKTSYGHSRFSAKVNPL